MIEGTGAVHRELFEAIVAEGCFILSRTRRDPAPLLTSGRHVGRLAAEAITEAARSPTDG